MTTQKFTVLLAVLTLVNIFVSWQVSIKAGRYHGIYRFFSFESILILVLLSHLSGSRIHSGGIR
jgi:hypothetical protein